MADAFLFSKPFTFLACPGMSEVRAGVDALESLPGHMFWLENEDFIRRVHVPDFLAQSRAALEAVMPGGVALVDAKADEIRRSTHLVPALQRLDAEAAAAAHSYCYWRYSADVLGRSLGIPRSAIERQFDRAVAPRDGAHKLEWICPCCDGQAHYQVDGLLASQRAARQGGFSVECPHCGHLERLYAGFLHSGRLECHCSICTGFIQTLAGQLARPARKLVGGLEAFAWKHAADAVAEIQELKEAALQRLARGDTPSENAMAFAHAVQADGNRPLPDILGDIDPTLEGRLDKNPRVWALLCELLQEGVLDCQCTIYDQDRCQRVALEIALLDEDSAAANPAAHEQLNTLLKGYQPSDRDAFINWLQALKRLRLCTARFNVAVDVSWKPSVEHCRILTARQPDSLAAAGPHASAPPRWQPAPRLRPPDRPVYLDAELEAVQLLKALGYIVFSPEDIRAQQDNLENIS
ncbi:hypothetical protein Tamer19_32760 [Cupriavidus sp. TA19]|uniref:hypothetical protein n=1 Tax=unclassified Cupriavidus TaxID=2640874 RepID=UPI000E2FEC2F|nr:MULTISPECIES: hypothetical protein [unclassified Cupriavidus]BDB27478.1 hypothetical protein CTP10_R48860 [Cupriavidus sp. P-10]GLC93868.1 hypothetical protein Tamer19_32760 [Cupriavidus sp. TA19]